MVCNYHYNHELMVSIFIVGQGQGQEQGKRQGQGQGQGHGQGQGQGRGHDIFPSQGVLFQLSLKRCTFDIVCKQQIRDGENILGNTCLLTCSLGYIYAPTITVILESIAGILEIVSRSDFHRFYGVQLTLIVLWPL